MNKSEAEIAQFFNFDTESIEVTKKDSYFTIKAIKCDKSFYFEPIEEHGRSQIVNDWVVLLNKAIDASDGKKKNHSYLPNKISDFYTQ